MYQLQTGQVVVKIAVVDRRLEPKIRQGLLAIKRYPCWKIGYTADEIILQLRRY